MKMKSLVMPLVTVFTSVVFIYFGLWHGLLDLIATKTPTLINTFWIHVLTEGVFMPIMITMHQTSRDSKHYDSFNE